MDDYLLDIMSSPTVLVTGASGFIGSHLIKELLVRGCWRVRGTLRGKITSERTSEISQKLSVNSTKDRSLELVAVDLNSEEGWKEAIHGCHYVFHVASPTSMATKDYDQDPAVRGTASVLKACTESESVKRVILTSSTACVTYKDDTRPLHTEEEWTRIEPDTPTYVMSKIKAERAAWDIVNQHNTNITSGNHLELAVINPGLVVGPHLLPNISNTGSFQLMKFILNGEMSAIPDLPFSLIHVKDVVDAHIAAAEVQEAAGHRHIVVDQFMSMLDIARVMKEEFEPIGYRVSTKKLPKFVVRFLKMVGNKDSKSMYPILGKKITFSNQRMREVLKITQTRDVTKGIIESCNSLIDTGLVSLPVATKNTIMQ